MDRTSVVRMIAKAFFALMLEVAIFGAVLFGAAGTVYWTAAWVYLALFFACALALTLLLAWKDPALLAERMKSPAQKDQPIWDKLFLAAMALTMAGWFVLMGLDVVRFHWSWLPEQLQETGAVLLVLSFVMISRVFLENTFLAHVVKIQADRGHRVISTGPYATVRHPMYAAVLIHLPATALLLGSLYGLAGSAVLLAGIVYRTVREDRKLRDELPGYREYAARVRYRLIPLVW